MSNAYSPWLQLWFQYHENGFTFIIAGFNFDSFLQFWQFFNGDGKHKGRVTPNWNSTGSIPIELRLFCANFQYGMILSTSLSEPLNYSKKINFCLLSANLDLPIMNFKNQNKPSVCQSLVLKVYFQKKVLCIARFYLFHLYKNNNSGPTY